MGVEQLDDLNRHHAESARRAPYEDEIARLERARE